MAQGDPPSELRTMSVGSGVAMNAAQAARFLKGLAMPYAALAIATLVQICRNARAPESARVQAAREILNRAFGKPDVMPVATAATSARTGVLLIPAESGRDEWARLSQEHHERMLSTSAM